MLSLLHIPMNLMYYPISFNLQSYSMGSSKMLKCHSGHRHFCGVPNLFGNHDIEIFLPPIVLNCQILGMSWQVVESKISTGQSCVTGTVKLIESIQPMQQCLVFMLSECHHISPSPLVKSILFQTLFKILQNR